MLSRLSCLHTNCMPSCSRAFPARHQTATGEPSKATSPWAGQGPQTSKGFFEQDTCTRQVRDDKPLKWRTVSACYKCHALLSATAGCEPVVYCYQELHRSQYTGWRSRLPVNMPAVIAASFELQAFNHTNQLCAGDPTHQAPPPI